ncbi:hypothetical protein XPA_008747 [Xanthoria parietina]
MCELLLSFPQLLALHLAGHLPPMAHSPIISSFFFSSTARCMARKQGRLKNLHLLRIFSWTPMHELEIFRLDLNSVTKGTEFAPSCASISTSATAASSASSRPWTSILPLAFACTYPIRGTRFASCGST